MGKKLEKVLNKGRYMRSKQDLFDYLDILFETETMKMELDNLSDDALLDECNHILSGLCESEVMDDILYDYFKNGSITPEQRMKAEAVYTLAYMEFIWEV